jgi:hypothetical protein
MTPVPARRVAGRYARNIMAAVAVTAVFALLAAGDNPRSTPGAIVAAAR